MSKGISTRTRTEHDDEHDGYVLVDTRNVILGLPEEVEAGGARRPLRAAIPQKSEPERWNEHRNWQAFTGPRRQAVLADASSTVSFWQRLARRVHHVWSGTRGTPRES
jgi:hypothetical protein